jgi:radical SAM protein (TIGR04043 family)
MDQMSPMPTLLREPLSESLSESRHLILELQSFGLRLTDARAGITARKGGAGPTDHKAITIGARTVMVPVYTGAARHSPFEATGPGLDGAAILLKDGAPVARILYPPQARFYALQTLDGIPYWQIAQLHSRDVLATTVLQNCIRYADRATSCQFCAIGQSLAEGRTIAHKTPQQLGEVARMAVLLDGVKHVVLTTGTPNVIDRGAAVLCESAAGIRAAVDIPIQAQCEPPRDHGWFARMREAGIDSLGMHLEAVTPEVRARIMPGKATVSMDRYFDAFAASVKIFGRGQVSTYILAGLGDTPEAILATCETLLALGVYPFVVPFVPVSGTPLADAPAPTPEFMRAVLPPLGRMVAAAGLRSADIKAGCGKCGACSALASFED